MLNGPRRIDFLLLPDFPLYAVVPAIEALRLANQNAGQRLYDWSFLSVSGGAVRASNGMAIEATHAISPKLLPTTLVVCAGNEPMQHLTRALLDWLRRLAAHGSVLGALDTGAFALAAAGVLAGYKLTLHWEAIPAFRDAYPDLIVLEQIYVVDRARITAAGGVAALDLMLAIIRDSHGERLAQIVADGFVHGRQRPPETPQLVEADGRISDRRLLGECVRLMKANLAFPLSVPDLCEQIGIPRRRLERLFAQHAHTTPARMHSQVRLEAARDQLFYTSNSVAHVATACGFLSNAHFSRAFSVAYGASPTVFRRRFAREARMSFHSAAPRLNAA